jgi:bacterioferritin-associated ferredoxin
MTARQYARLVAEWIGGIGLDPRTPGIVEKCGRCLRHLREMTLRSA